MIEPAHYRIAVRDHMGEKLFENGPATITLPGIPRIGDEIRLTNVGSDEYVDALRRVTHVVWCPNSGNWTEVWTERSPLPGG